MCLAGPDRPFGARCDRNCECSTRLCADLSGLKIEGLDHVCATECGPDGGCDANAVCREGVCILASLLE
jgi:hypothetical protein